MATILHQLYVHVKDLNDKGDTTRDVDQIVAIAQAACRLCPHHFDCMALFLATLAIFHRHRFQRQRAIMTYARPCGMVSVTTIH